jgi:hypothetical protein
MGFSQSFYVCVCLHGLGQLVHNKNLKDQRLFDSYFLEN